MYLFVERAQHFVNSIPNLSDNWVIFERLMERKGKKNYEKWMIIKMLLLFYYIHNETMKIIFWFLPKTEKKTKTTTTKIIYDIYMWE